MRWEKLAITKASIFHRLRRQQYKWTTLVLMTALLLDMRYVTICYAEL